MRLAILFIAVSLVSTITVASSKKVVCYFGAWSVFRENNGKIEIDGIDASLCTHLIYSFIGVKNSEVAVLDTWSDLPENLDGFRKFVGLHERSPFIKIMVAVGGWKAESVPFSQMASSQSTREAFVQSIIKFLQDYGFDGLDIDWEYPAQRGGSPADVQNMVELCKDLKKAFAQHGYLLSVAVAAAETSASKSYNIAEMSEYVDFINLMTYDFHGAYDGHTGLHAALSASSSDVGNDAKFNVKSAVQYWLDNGAPKEKLVVGIPTYGRSFTLSNPSNHGLGAPVSGPGKPGPYTKEAGLLGYNEICEMQKSGGWNLVSDMERGEPYLFKGDQWVSYDDLTAVANKAKFIKEQGLGGAMVWSIETDDFKGICGEQWGLLKIINSALGREAGDNDSFQDESSVQYPPGTREVPIKPVESSGGEVCSYVGQFFTDGDTCGYLMCDHDGKGGFRKIHGDCPPTLCFDVNKQYCDVRPQ